ncbi:MAG: DNA topoisomerase I [Candidatus Bathyarchaeia archaeon]
MKYCMKSLKHNGIYVPPYEYQGLSVKVHGQTVKLSPETEQMAIAWARKKLSVTSPPDKLFYRNFVEDFLKALNSENPSQGFLKDFTVSYIKSLKRDDGKWVINGRLKDDPEVDFSEVTEHVLREQQKKLNMTKEERKRIAAERKARREGLREDYGYATVDDRKLEIANWTAEPSCIFAGRGDHPRRGKWKQGPKEEDIVLNLSDPRFRPAGSWKTVVWEPEKMYIAKWEDKLSGKMKYVWFSDSAFLKQKMEKEKFKKAEKLDKEIPKVEEHIMKNLGSEDLERRKIATVCWLILKVNIRVGDEKDPGEADTVGAITLRPEHIKIEGNLLNFDFLGKDCVKWKKKIEAPPVVIRNIQEFSKQNSGYLFAGTNSRKVSRFLSQKMEGLTAKVFRTWRCTQTVSRSLEDCKVKKADADYLKQFCAKMANLEAAKIANHKRKIPPNFDERLKKKEARVKELELKLKEKEKEEKKTEALVRSLEKTKLDVRLTKETQEYNLGTSLKSYIDPMVYVKWACRMDFPLDKLYPKTLRKKFSWALGAECK